LARRLLGLVVLIRLPSCLAGGVSVFLGMHLATGRTWPDPAAWLGMLSMFFAVAAANAINDVLDADADAVGKPGRPLPAGRLGAWSAMAAAGAAATASIGLAGALGGTEALWAMVLLAIAFLYSYCVKNTVLLGNAVVGLCACSPILFGALIAGRFRGVTWVGTGLSFFFMFTYETLKTIADRESDAASGVHTFAVKAGLRSAVILLRGLVALLTILTAAASAVSSRPALYLAAVLITFVLPAWSAVAALGHAQTRKSINASIVLMRWAWSLGIIALWLLC
jgi:4-hydroxybenzoate polyprenyltransferase